MSDDNSSGAPVAESTNEVATTSIFDYSFKSYGKIPRWSKDIVISEKIDGTNAQILIGPDGSIRTGSRNRWVTPDNDNFGFATWVHQNLEDIKSLGIGRFYGEWWGLGIQRGYKLFERRFTLFVGQKISKLPECMIGRTPFVPILYQGANDHNTVDSVMQTLRGTGSQVAPGFMEPEGVVIFHDGSRQVYKKTYDNDREGKNARV